MSQTTQNNSQLARIDKLPEIKMEPGMSRRSVSTDAIESDYYHVKGVFLEQGFLTYFPLYCFRALSNELRKRNINNFLDRQNAGLNVRELLASLDIAGAAFGIDDSRGVAKESPGVANTSSVPANPQGGDSQEKSKAKKQNGKIN